MTTVRLDRLKPRARLGRGQKEILFRHLLRLPVLFELARGKLRLPLPGPLLSGRGVSLDELTTRTLAASWNVALRVVTRYCSGTTLPAETSLAWSMVSAELEAMQSSGELDLTEDERVWLTETYRLPASATQTQDVAPTDEEARLLPGGYLAYVFGSDQGLNEEWGRRLLADYLQEVAVYDPLSAVVHGMGTGALPQDLNALLDMLQRRQQTSSVLLSSQGLGNLLGSIEQSDEEFFQTAAPKVVESTGVEYIDLALDGGDAPGEVYGFAGAVNSGKTTQAIQLGIAKARLFQYLHQEKGEPLRSVHLFSYEAGLDELRSRVIGHVAQIHNDSWCTAHQQGFQHLSERGNLKPYEMELFRRQIEVLGIENVDGERERLTLARSFLSKNFYLHDFSNCVQSGSSGVSSSRIGSGYVEEVAQALHEHKRQGIQPGCVIIDYVGLMARRYWLVTGGREDQLRSLIAGCVDLFRGMVAEPFHSCVWLFHQLKGLLNSRAFNARVGLADMAESSSFGENLHGLLAFGVPDLPTKSMMFHVCKVRRPRTLDAPIMLHVKPGLHVIDRAQHLVVDHISGRPVPREDASILMDLSQEVANQTLDNLVSSVLPDQVTPGTLAGLSSHEIDEDAQFFDEENDDDDDTTDE